jgi:ATP-dependent RNA helicase HelY
MGQVFSLANELRDRESAAGLEPMGELDAGFMAAAWRWASGRPLDEALGWLEITGGDFVRNVKQMADLAGQLHHAADGPLADAADQAVDALRRGIVEA